jgi:hypothetical protein
MIGKVYRWTEGIEGVDGFGPRFTAIRSEVPTGPVQRDPDPREPEQQSAGRKVSYIREIGRAEQVRDLEANDVLGRVGSLMIY